MPYVNFAGLTSENTVQDEPMLHKMLCLVCCILFMFAGSLFGQQSNPAAQNNARQQPQNSKQIARELIPPGRQGPSQVTPTTPVAPEWTSSLTQEHQQFISQLLDYWQQSSQKVKQYQCEFARYDYDTKFVNYRDPKSNRLAAASIMTGEIRFAGPDKASYETLQVFDFPGPPEQEGQTLDQYILRKGETNREKWICDGKAIFEHDFENKKLYETTIPAEMQGKGLVNSPIPFLFGASKDNILSRFWVRIITPDGVENEYWLEAIPKKIDDARNYKKVEIVISREEFLPTMLNLYAPDYNPAENNFSRRLFEFENRKVNTGVSKIQNFFGRFVRPATPMGWERVQRKSLQASNPEFDRARLQRPAQRTDNRQIK